MRTVRPGTECGRWGAAVMLQMSQTVLVTNGLQQTGVRRVGSGECRHGTSRYPERLVSNFRTIRMRLLFRNIHS